MTQQFAPGFGLYDVKGVKEPLVLSEEHAKEIKAKPHDSAAASDAGGSGSPRPPTVKEILAEVGDDQEKAAAALELEQASDSPRVSLVAKLEAIATPPEA